MKDIVITIILMVIVTFAIVVGCDKIIEKLPVDKSFQKFYLQLHSKLSTDLVTGNFVRESDITIIYVMLGLALFKIKPAYDMV